MRTAASWFGPGRADRIQVRGAMVISAPRWRAPLRPSRVPPGEAARPGLRSRRSGDDERLTRTAPYKFAGDLSAGDNRGAAGENRLGDLEEAGDRFGSIVPLRR